MDDNQIISEWWFKAKGYTMGDAPSRWSCGCSVAWVKEGDAVCPQCMGINYSDLSAWDADMYKLIEDNKLVPLFNAHCLWPENYAGRLTYLNNPCRTFTATSIFDIITLSPTQKAQALAQAIRSVTNEHTR